MCVKINNYRNMSIHKRESSQLINRRVSHEPVPVYHGNNVMKDSHIGRWNVFVFRVIDGLSSKLVRHPKLAARVIKIGEKFVKNSNVI